VQSAFTVTQKEGHVTVNSHEFTSKVLKIVSTAIVEDICTLTLTSI